MCLNERCDELVEKTLTLCVLSVLGTQYVCVGLYTIIIDKINKGVITGKPGGAILNVAENCLCEVR